MRLAQELAEASGPSNARSLVPDLESSGRVVEEIFEKGLARDERLAARCDTELVLGLRDGVPGDLLVSLRPVSLQKSSDSIWSREPQSHGRRLRRVSFRVCARSSWICGMEVGGVLVLERSCLTDLERWR